MKTIPAATRDGQLRAAVAPGAMIIRTQAYARAGLVGNPSDNYFGKTIAFTVKDFAAEVVLYESPRLEILPHDRDHSRFDSVGALVEDVRLHGYYGGVRLLKAAIKRFAEYCRQQGIEIAERNFTIGYHSEIPRLVGLGGSSAIITAAFRAMMQFYQVDIPRQILPSLILSVETDELGIEAGLQDRVAQVYEGLVYMDFARELLEARGYGHYEPLDPALLPDPRRAAPSERSHSAVRVLYNRGDKKVIETLAQIADLADEARQCLLNREPDRLAELINRNFDLRARIFRIGPANMRMVETARRVGASAKFAGSGGTIVGTYESPAMLARLREALEAIGCVVVTPRIG